MFIGPQIRQRFKYQQYEAVLSYKEKAAWQYFEKISNRFLGNFEAKNFRELGQLNQFYVLFTYKITTATW